MNPDRYILIGNHRDSWSFGAIDPTTGAAVLLETSRLLGSLKKNHGLCYLILLVRLFYYFDLLIVFNMKDGGRHAQLCFAGLLLLDNILSII